MRKRKDREFMAKLAKRADELGDAANVVYGGGNMRIGRVLNRWRLLSQREVSDVSKEIGINASTLRRLEAGKQMPDGQTILRIINWLFSEGSNANSSDVERIEHEHSDSGKESSDVTSVRDGD